MSEETPDHGIRFGRIAPCLPVHDMARAHDFYTGVLGFRKLAEAGDPVYAMVLQRDWAELNLTLQRNYMAAPFNVVDLQVEDIEALHELCREHALRIVKATHADDQDHRLESFVFADPDGNRIEVRRQP